MLYLGGLQDCSFIYCSFIKDVDEMEQIYNQLVPSCKKVLKILKPDIRDLHEQTSYDFLKKFIRSLKDAELRSFLRYCIGADVMCFEKIEVTFSNLKGAQRRDYLHMQTNDRSTGYMRKSLWIQRRIWISQYFKNWILEYEYSMKEFKGAIMKIEKATKKWSLHVCKVYWKFCIPNIYQFVIINR